MYLKFDNFPPIKIDNSSMRNLEMIIAARYTKRKFGKWEFSSQQISDQCCFRCQDKIKYIIDINTPDDIEYFKKME